MAGAPGAKALEAIVESRGSELHQLCWGLAGDGADALFAATTERAGREFAGRDTGEPAFEWLCRLANEEAEERPEAQPAGLHGDSLTARFFAMARSQRAALMLSEVLAFGADTVGGVLGCTGDTVEDTLRGARQALTAITARSGAECFIIRDALTRSDLPPLAHAAVERHVAACAACRRVQWSVASIGPGLKRAAPRVSTVALIFMLREGLAHAAVGGGPAAHARRPRRSHVPALAAVGTVMVAAALAVQSGRLAPDRGQAPVALAMPLRDLGLNAAPPHHRPRHRRSKPNPPLPPHVHPIPIPIPVRERGALGPGLGKPTRVPLHVAGLGRGLPDGEPRHEPCRHPHHDVPHDEDEHGHGAPHDIGEPEHGDDGHRVHGAPHEVPAREHGADDDRRHGLPHATPVTEHGDDHDRGRGEGRVGSRGGSD